MPFGLSGAGGRGGGGGGGDYKDLERAPLSALDDDDDDDVVVSGMMSLPPYSDNPVTPTNGDGNRRKRENGGYRDEPTRKEKNGRGVGKGARAITIVDDDDDDDDVSGLTPQFLRNKAPGGGRGGGARADRGYDDDDDDDEGYGEGDYFNDVNTPSKNRRPTRRYRGGLVCAYLRHWLACRCCLGCCAADPNSSSRNIGGPSYEKGKCARRTFMALFYLSLLFVILLCSAAIGYIIAQDGSPFKPDETSSASSGGDRLPPPLANLREICTDWITESGRQKCREECGRAMCCSLPSEDGDSCWADQASECAEYRVACMGMELNVGTYDSTGTEGPGMGLPSKVELDPPGNLARVCSYDSLQTHEGFDDCSSACLKSRCCKPDVYGCEVVDYEYCGQYEAPCATVAASWRGSGHAVASNANDSSQQDAVANAVMLHCNSANLNPPDGCIEACKPGACCYVSDSYPPIEQLFREHYGYSPMSNVESCSSNVGFCQQFGSCEHLNHLEETESLNAVDVTYKLDITNVCKAEYIAQFGALECSNVCQPAHCCFSQEYKCDDVQLGQIVCGDYMQCGVLYPSQTSTEEMFAMARAIDDVCAEDSLSLVSARKMCQKLCKDHLCCFDTGAYGCANDPSKNCLEYAGCETLVSTSSFYFDKEEQTDSTDAEKLTDPNEVEAEDGAFLTALKAACSETTLKTLEGIQQCHNKCQTHLCCFTNDVALAGNDCSNAHGEGCMAYQPCERLVTPTAQNPLTSTTSDLDEIAEAIEKACALPDDPYLVDQSWVEGCHSLCAPRLCCLVDAKIGSNCRATVGTKECNAYSACEILINDSGQEVTGAKQIEDKFGDLNDVCTIAVVQDSSLHAACEERCKDRSCCFESTPAFSCYDMESEWCDEFKSCECVEMFFFSDKVSQNTDDISSVQASEPASVWDNAFEAALETACSETTLKTLEGIQQCHNKCQTHLCCFTNDVALAGNDCSNAHVEGCNAYQPCERLVTPTAQNPLTSTTSDLDEIAEAIEKACALPDDPYLVDQSWVEGCHSLCAPRLCCLVDAKIGSNCRATVGTKECNAYSACEILINDSGQEVTGAKQIEDKFGDLNDVCTIAVVQDSSLHAACEERCKDRSCCFESTPAFSCYDMESEWCDEFKSCECVDMIFLKEKESQNTDELKSSTAPTIDSGSATSPPEIDANAGVVESTTVATELTTVATVAFSENESFKSTCTAHTFQLNWDTCKDLCIQYECCFRSEFSCYKIHEAECDDHYICEEFYNKDGSVKLNTAPTIDSGSTTSISNQDITLNDSANSAPEIDEFKASIEAACSSESLTTLEGITECYNKCQAHLCCVSSDVLGDFDCSDTYPDECNAYQVCDQLVSRYNIWSPPSTSFDPFAVKRLVDVACIPRDSAPVTREWVTKCHEVCEAHMCCLAHPSLGSSCVDVLGDGVCGDYSACQNLIGGELRDLDSINDLCNSDVSSNKELFLECREKCMERSCCFEDNPDYSCYEMEKDWCNEYESCKLVGFTFLGSAGANAEVVESTTVATVTIIKTVDFDQIESRCSNAYISAFGTEDCQLSCEPVKCCFDFAQCTYANEADCSRVNDCNNGYN